MFGYFEQSGLRLTLITGTQRTSESACSYVQNTWLLCSQLNISWLCGNATVLNTHWYVIKNSFVSKENQHSTLWQILEFSNLEMYVFFLNFKTLIQCFRNMLHKMGTENKKHTASCLQEHFRDEETKGQMTCSKSRN